MPLVESGSSVVINIAVATLRAYQKILSPILGANCRFYPSCSEYSIQALQKYGLFRGLFITMVRLAKCHPFHPGGYDPVR